MKPELILHVGMDKTGTTSIQFALDKAQERLKAEFSLLVPRKGLWSDKSHHPFAFAAFGINGFVRADLAGLLDQLETEVARSGCERVLISSECLFKLPGHPGMAPFMAGLRRIFSAIRVIVYVRRQDRWVESRYRHSVISGLEIPLVQLSQPRFSDYLPYIDRWADEVGQTNVQVRAYEPVQFPAGDIAADFEKATGLPTGVLPSLSGTQANVAHSFEVVQLRAAFNHLDLPQHHLVGLNDLLAACAVGGPAERTFVSPQKARQLVGRYAGSNRQIAIKYMGRPGGRLFFDPPPPDAAHVAPEIAPERLREILGAVKERDPELLRLAARAGANLRDTDLRFADAAVQVARLMNGLREMGLADEVQARPPMEEPPLSRPERLSERVRGILRRVRLHALGLVYRARVALRNRVKLWLWARRLAAAPLPSAAREPAPLSPGDPRASEALVHFGVFKTGSTSIQQTLFNHSAGLSNCAYLDAGVPNHSLLVSAAVLDAPTVRKRHAEEASPKDLQLRKEVFTSRFTLALSEAAKSGRIVISAESISGFNSAELEILRALLAPHAARIRFFGYMRDPVSLTQSVFQEQIKSRLPRNFKFANLAEQGPPRLYGIVDRLDALFGPESVSVYPFDPASFPERDVVRHFLEVADIKGQGLTSVRVNERLSALASKALYCTRIHGGDESLRFAQSRQAFIADLRSLNGPPFVFHPELNDRIRQNCGVWDEWAARRLGRPLVYQAAEAETGIRVEADLLTFSESELDELAGYGARHGVDVITPRSGAEDVAELVGKVRTRFVKGKVQ